MDELQLGDHVCVLVDGVEDVVEGITRTIAAGLAAGDRVMAFTASVPPAQAPARLEGHGPVARVPDCLGVTALPAVRLGRATETELIA